MDNFSTISRAKTNLSMTTSKLIAKDHLFGLNQLRLQQKLNHQNCQCFHCLNNTKPIPQPIHPRINAIDQYQKSDNQAYAFMIQKMSDFIGNVKIPDTFIAQSSSLACMANQNKYRIKLKPNTTLAELKKYFDSRKIQYTKIIKAQNQFNFGKAQRNNSKSFNLSDIRLARRQPTNSEGVKKQKQMKQIAMINYTSNYSQLVVESSLNKYLAKRKNDPFWQQIATISLIPPYKEDELAYHRYFYERTQGNLKEMQKQMQRMASIIDGQDMYNDMISFNSTMINPQAQLTTEKTNQNFQVIRHKMSSPENIEPSYLRNNSVESLNLQKIDIQTIAKMSKQIVAYFQVKLHIRISSCLFKYMIDFQGNFYLTGVEKFIAHNLKPKELHFIHDRLTHFEINDSEEIAQLKMQAQSKESLALQSQLAQLVAECLQKRKLQLQGTFYKRPSNEVLVKIFKKVFPTFNEEEMFANKNWKNQFPVYMQNCRKTINKVIREDQGIRILKRFGIQFYRTWN